MTLYYRKEWRTYVSKLKQRLPCSCNARSEYANILVVLHAQLPPGRKEGDTKANAAVGDDLGSESSLVGVAERNVLNADTS
jgi:hypothetical protein